MTDVAFSIFFLLMTYQFFVEDEDIYINNLKNALTLFELASSLKINISKSTISLINISANRATRVANMMGISQQFLPVNYLGVPLGGKPNSKLFWNQITDKIHKRLNGWKYSHKSKGGRLTLIKSSLQSIPRYQLSTFKASNHVQGN